LVYFPYNFTPEYIAFTETYDICKDDEYHKWYNENLKGQGNFPLTTTTGYQQLKALEPIKSAKQYRQDYENEKSSGEYTKVVDYREAHNIDLVQPLFSLNSYKKRARDILGKYNLTIDMPQITTAIRATNIASLILYQKSYKENEVGKGAKNFEKSQAIQQPIKANKLSSMIRYVKEALNSLSDINYDFNARNIKHAVDVYDLSSQIKYTLDGKKIQTECKGYKKCGFQDIPEYMRMQKLNHHYSKKHYRSEYDDTKDMVYFPYNLTQEYESKTPSKNVLSKSNYEREYQNNKNLVEYQYNQIEEYLINRKLDDLLSIYKHKKAAQQWRATGFTVLAKDTFNDHIKDVQLRISSNVYKEAAWDIMNKYNLTIDIPDIQRAIYADYIASDNVYKVDFKKFIVGFGMDYHENIPMFVHHKKMKKLVNQKAYKAKADNEMHDYHVVPDAPPIIQAKKAVDQASDVKYKAPGLEIRTKTRGYQRLTADERNDVKNSIRVTDLCSINKYKEEYNRLRDMVYFPFDLTDEYDAASKTMWNQSKNKYSHEALQDRHKIEFKLTDTDEYQIASELHRTVGDIAYIKEHLDDLRHSPYVTDTPLRALYRSTKVLYSDRRYRKKAKDVMDQYDLITDEPRLQQAIYAMHILSDNIYKDEYEKEKGFGAINLHQSPFMKAQIKANILTSNIPYQKEAKSQLKEVVIPEDTLAIRHAQDVALLPSDNVYKLESKGIVAHGYNTILLKDNYLLRHFEKVRELSSDVKYKADLYYLQGHLIPVPDTPFNLNAIAQTIRQSDNVYKQDFKTEIQGVGLTDLEAREFEHQKNMKIIHDETEYRREVLHELPFWQEEEAANTPFAIKAHQANINSSQINYKKEYESEKGKGCYEITPIISKAQEADKLASSNVYIREHKEDSKNAPEFSSLETTPALEKASEVNKFTSDVKYKDSSKIEKARMHPHKIDSKIEAVKKATSINSELKYRAKDKEVIHHHKAKETDTFTKKAIDAQNVVSNNKYVEEYKENLGVCSSLPEEKKNEHLWLANELTSDNKYKEESKKMKGQTMVPPDAPEYEHVRKVTDHISQIKYEAEGKDKSNFTVLAKTPQTKLAAKVTAFVSDIKYKANHKKTKSQYTVLENDPKIEHAQQVNKHQSKNNYQQKDKKQRHETVYSKVLPETIEVQQTLKAQKNISDVEYKKNKSKNFTILQQTPAIAHAMKTNKIQSDLIYKQKGVGKTISSLETPAMKHALKANKLQSQLEYQKKHVTDRKKGWRFIKDMPSQKHVEDISQVQSQFKYTKDHRENDVGRVTSVTERPDIQHAVSRKDIISDYEYTRQHRDKISEGYTFTPDAPSIQHAGEVTTLQSELQYRRKYDNIGKGWQVEASPAIEHYKEAQKLTDKIDYQKTAKEINSRGSMATMDEDPIMVQQVKAQKLLDKQDYKADYTKNMQGKAMTYDLHGTCQFDHVKRAEEIKSDLRYHEDYEKKVKGKGAVVSSEPSLDVSHAKEATRLSSDKIYKADYERTIKGKGATVTSKPTMSLACAQKATKIVNEANYRQDLRNMTGKGASQMLDTPDLRRVKKTQKIYSQVDYKADAEKLKGKGSQTMVTTDTPDMRLVRKNQHNFSDVLYKDVSHRTSIGCLDTPAYRTALKNSKNFSQNKYKQHIGSHSQVEDMRMQHARSVSRIAGDNSNRKASSALGVASDAYLSNSRLHNRPPSGFNKDFVTNGTAGGFLKHSEPARSQTASGWRQAVIGRPQSAQGVNEAINEARSRSNQGWRNIQRPRSASGQRRRYGYGYEPEVNNYTDWSRPASASGRESVASSTGSQHKVIVEYDLTRGENRVLTPGPALKHRAMYNYEATAHDEVSFNAGDIIINAMSIDDGSWMLGTVVRSGLSGMLPSNYVRPIAG